MNDNDERRLSGQWGDLAGAGAVPTKGKGTTAERAERDEKRKRKRMPTEDKRRGCKITPTLSLKLVNRLRTICKEQGHINKSGDGIITSTVIEDLLWAAVEAYERGEFETEEEVVEVRRRLRRSPRK